MKQKGELKNKFLRNITGQKGYQERLVLSFKHKDLTISAEKPDLVGKVNRKFIVKTLGKKPLISDEQQFQ